MARKNTVDPLRLGFFVLAAILLSLAGCGTRESLPVASDSSTQTAVAQGAGGGSALPFQIDETDLPTVEITVPELLPIEYLDLCPHFYLEWAGHNPVGDEADLLYKYITIPESDLPGGLGDLPPLDHEWGLDHQCPPLGYWSEWVPSDCTYVRDMDLSDFLGTTEKVYVIVNVKHKSGLGTNRIFYGSNNWFKCIIISECSRLPLHLEDQMLGVRTSFNPSEYETKVAYIYEGTEILPRFWGLEDRSRGEIADAYRYYFDDPGSPTWDTWTRIAPLRREGYSPEWIVRFPPDGIPFAPSIGPHEFVIEVSDYNSMVSHCEFQLEVLEGPQSNSGHLIYFVDDCRGLWLEPTYPLYEERSDSLWAAILDGYPHEICDTESSPGGVSPSALGLASTVIWNVDPAIETRTHLLEVCSEYNNYLYSYVKTGGNLIIIGRDPIYSHAYWPNRKPTSNRRATWTDLDFSPKFEPVDSITTYNFNWDVFGISRMEVLAGVRFSTLHPCETGWDPIEAGDAVGPPYWDGVFNGAFFVTEVRTDIDVRTIYGVVPLDSHGAPQPPDCSRWLGVYVPGDGIRGHAAYIAVPPLLCDHDQIKAMVRELLTLFGE